MHGSVETYTGFLYRGNSWYTESTILDGTLVLFYRTASVDLGQAATGSP